MVKKFSHEWYHNKGEMDQKKGNRDSPRPRPLREIIQNTRANREDHAKGNAYDDGWRNAEKTKR